MSKTLLLLALLLPHLAYGGVVSRLTDFVPNTKAEADQVDAEFDNILSTINGSIDSANIASSGVVTANLAASSVTASKIASYTITQIKMGSVGQQLSSLVNTNITGLATAEVASVTLTTYGRPVFVGLIPSSAASSDISGVAMTLTTAVPGIGTVVAGNMLLARNSSGGVSNHITRWIPSSFAAATRDSTSPGGSSNVLTLSMGSGQFWTIDPVGPGTWTYVLRVSANNAGTTVGLNNLKLIALEL